MHDDYLTPIWADRHGAVSGFVLDLVRQTRIAFERLAARTYDAPWKREEQGIRISSRLPAHAVCLTSSSSRSARKSSTART